MKRRDWSSWWAERLLDLMMLAWVVVMLWYLVRVLLA